MNHVVFERDGYMSLVERTVSGLGRIGTGGLITEQGYAALTWRGGEAVFVAKGGHECMATEADVAALRKFQADLEQAIAG